VDIVLEKVVYMEGKFGLSPNEFRQPAFETSLSVTTEHLPEGLAERRTAEPVKNLL
jgi:hypothetical protein